LIDDFSGWGMLQGRAERRVPCPCVRTGMSATAMHQGKELLSDGRLLCDNIGGITMDGLS